jgi:glutamate---cysteine ligase / carboxylate-amine ligase
MIRLFEATGIELEYMIVDRETLAVRPVADRLLAAQAGQVVSDVAVGPVTWSNELALHVIEMKTSAPATRLAGLAADFSASAAAMNDLLAPEGAMLLGTAMHPTMDPSKDMVLWPHDNNDVYSTFNRIFDCRGHGWTNLQSMHINLPFADDAELGRLHAAIRMVLPLLPGLAASSPIADGRVTGLCDTRLEHYRHNSKRIPSVCGLVIPEQVFTRKDYETRILERIWADTAPHDPEGVLRYEWANARGAIARFDRNTIEIRLLDVQECPRSDLAIAALVRAAVRAFVEERILPYEAQQAWHERDLAAILLATMRGGDLARIDDSRYVEALGWRRGPGATAGALWAHLAEHSWRDAAEQRELGEAVELLLAEGCLSRRICAALPDAPELRDIAGVYARLAECLADDRMFCADA